MSDAVQTPPEPDVAVVPSVDPSPDPFATVPPEGPFGFKPDRNRPIEPHFDGFGRLTPEQARQVLDVRDGRQPLCLIDLPTETVLFEHAGQGYCDPATGRQWGYRVRRVVRHGPTELPPQSPQADSPPPMEPVELLDPPPAITVPAEPVRWVAPPRIVPNWAAPEPHAEAVADPFPAHEQTEPDEEWFAPARSPRSVALADPAERTALVRVLVLWFVVAMLLADCVTLLMDGR